MDIKSPEERSRNMAAIRSRNTKPEVYFRKLLFAQGYRYSLNSGKVPGHPDIYLRKYNTAIEFWQKKFEANVKRDYVVRMELQKKGVKCLIVWECTVKKLMKDRDLCEKYLETVKRFFESKDLRLEI